MSALWVPFALVGMLFLGVFLGMLALALAQVTAPKERER